MTWAAGTAGAGITRFNFISGRAGSGMRALARVLTQNPRFSVRVQSGAAALYDGMHARLRVPGSAEGFLDEGQRKALLRGMFEAVHHDRKPGCVVFDCDPAWFERTQALAALFPLARFVLIVDGRRPAHPALQGAAADRVLALDSGRLRQEPEAALDALYHMLREPPFPHDTAPLEGRLTEGSRVPAERMQGDLRVRRAMRGRDAPLRLQQPIHAGLHAEVK